MNGTHDGLLEWWSLSVSEAGGLQSCVCVLQRLQGCCPSLHTGWPRVLLLLGRGVQLLCRHVPARTLYGCHHHSASFWAVTVSHACGRCRVTCVPSSCLQHGYLMVQCHHRSASFGLLQCLMYDIVVPRRASIAMSRQSHVCHHSTYVY